MKEIIIKILNNYLLKLSEEKERQAFFLNYLKKHNDMEIADWNNFDGHIVASGFVYAIKDKKFLVLYHNDLKMFLYPGGNIDKKDENPLVAAKREVIEETGLTNFKVQKITDDLLVPIDIDTHKVAYNERLKLPKHFHFDFRYLFIVDSIGEVEIDKNESSAYKWINIEELNQGKVTEKLLKIIDN